MAEKARTRQVLDADDIARSLKRIAHEILERNRGAENLVLLGIPTRGVPLAHRLRDALAEAGGADVPAGSLDVTMYRDDLRARFENEHAVLRAMHAAPEYDNPLWNVEFATLLRDHARFEERELFPAIEKLLPPVG